MKPYDAIFTAPSHVPPQQPVRYWGNAFLYGTLVFWCLYPVLLSLLHLFAGLPSLYHMLSLGTVFSGYIVSLGFFEAPYIHEMVLASNHPLLLKTGLWVTFLVSSLVAAWVIWWSLEPRANSFHMSGRELKEGKAAERELKRISSTMSPGGLRLKLGRHLILDKKRLGEHVLICGGVGSGKTVLMMDMARQLLAEKTAIPTKCFIYDVKGDYTARFPQACIVSPYDERSRRWDIGRDVRTANQAHIFAQSLISEEGSNPYFPQAARLVLAGTIIALQETRGTDWDFKTLAEHLNKPSQDQYHFIKNHYPKAALVLDPKDDKTPAAVIATLAANTRLIDDLAKAWGPYVLDKYGMPRIQDDVPLERKTFSLREWMKDDYKGPPHLIVQGGGDPQLTKSYIAAMVNCITPELISPGFPDNEEGRCIAFFLDEMPSIGKIQDFTGLVDKGRSKGICVIQAYQDIGQMKDLYGENQTLAMQSMTGTHFYGRMQQGQTVDTIAKNFSTKFIANWDHGKDAKGREEGKAVIYPDTFMTDLGFRKGKQMGPEKWGIRMIVATGSHNPCMVDIEGRTYKSYRPSLIKAFWTRPETQVVRSLDENFAENTAGSVVASLDMLAGRLDALVPSVALNDKAEIIPHPQDTPPLDDTRFSGEVKPHKKRGFDRGQQ